MSKVNFKIPGLCWPKLAWGHEGRCCATVPKTSQECWTLTGSRPIRKHKKSPSLERAGLLPRHTHTPAYCLSPASRHLGGFHSSSKNTDEGYGGDLKPLKPPVPISQTFTSARLGMWRYPHSLFPGVSWKPRTKKAQPLRNAVPRTLRTRDTMCVISDDILSSSSPPQGRSDGDWGIWSLPGDALCVASPRMLGGGGP